MKAPRFWYPQKNDIIARLIAVLISPLSLFFIAGSYVRRLCARPYHARVPVICVGNVVAGGAGKTPAAIALAKLLRERGQKPVFVTRGYGGNGVVTYVDIAQHNAADVGDEALLLAAVAPTWVGLDRAEAMRQAESNGTLIIMDDGLQNPHIAPTASVLVVDGQAGIGNGFIIPAGPLRESLACALRRVGAVVIVGEGDPSGITRRAKVPVLRATLQPELPRGFPRWGKFVAFAGIARPQKFYATARALGLDIADTFDFPDHHPFTEADIDMLRMAAEEEGARLLTTTKDAVRLPPAFLAQTLVLPVALIFEDAAAAGTLAGLIRDLL